MRDAFGGVFMMRLMLVFIVILVGFGAISLNYAKAFRIKNKVIDVVEQVALQKSDFGIDEENNAININTFLNGPKNIKQKLDNIVEEANYTITCKDGRESSVIKENKIDIGICYKGIYILINTEHEENDKDAKNDYYDVITYGGWNLSALNMLLALGGRNQNSEGTLSGRWKINGEAIVPVPYSDEINDGRKYEGECVYVTKCQPRVTNKGQCIIGDGTLVIRKHLGYCDYDNFSDEINDGRWYKDRGKCVEVIKCQPKTLTNGQEGKCALDDGTLVIRSHLHNGHDCEHS